jgi:hypothetical protein
MGADGKGTLSLLLERPTRAARAALAHAPSAGRRWRYLGLDWTMVNSGCSSGVNIVGMPFSLLDPWDFFSAGGYSEHEICTNCKGDRLFELRPRARSFPSRRFDIAILCFSKTCRLHILFAFTPA